MAICCCSLAGTAACQRCLNNPSATEPTTKLTTYTTTILPYSNLYKNLMEESEPKPEIVKCKDCEFYIKHDKRCVVWNHGVSKDDYCSRGQKKEVEE